MVCPGYSLRIALRIAYQGAAYCATSRGDDRGLIFRDDEDRCAFVDVVSDVLERCNWAFYAYCLACQQDHQTIPKGTRQDPFLVVPSLARLATPVVQVPI